MIRVAFSVLIFLVMVMNTSCNKLSCDKDGDEVSETGGFSVHNISSKVSSFLGDEIVDILKQPDSVVCYKLGFSNADKKGETIGGYHVTGKGRDLIQKQMEIFQSVFLNEHSYVFGVVKKCFFLPEYAMKVKKAEREVVLLISYSCEEVKFVFNGKERIGNIDNATNKLKLLTNSLFD